MIEASVKYDKKELGVLSSMADMDHEQLLFCNDKATGLKAIIAVHNTVLGPSLGGTRMWSYASEADALQDVLRLSRGMTYKSAISGINLGGGKAVIIGNARTDKSEALFRRFGKFVESLNGKYITAEDVGINPKDISYMAMETDYVAGLPKAQGGSGDPSPVTAFGVYMGMKGAAKFAYGSESLEGRKIAVQGVGHVGSYLVDSLVKEGAKVVITDIHEELINAVTTKHSQVEVVSVDDIYDVEMDIYAPCALGATVNDDTLNRLKCSVICGAANNQLENEQTHGKALLDKGVVYAPDFLVNAGGVMNCYAEVAGHAQDWAMAETENIYHTTIAILEHSRSKGIPVQEAAIAMAKDRINKIGQVKLPL